MNLILQNDTTARIAFGSSEQWPLDDGIDHGARPTPAMLRTLADIAELVSEHATLTVCRDWEGCAIGIWDSADVMEAWDAGLPDIISLGENGSIGAGGVNLPRMYGSVLQFVSSKVTVRSSA